MLEIEINKKHDIRTLMVRMLFFKIILGLHRCLPVMFLDSQDMSFKNFKKFVNMRGLN